MGRGDCDPGIAAMVGDPADGAVSRADLASGCDGKEDISLPIGADAAILDNGVTGRQIGGGGELEGTQACTGGILANSTVEGQDGGRFALARKLQLSRRLAILHDHGRSGIGIAVVQRQQLVAVSQDKLVEGVAHIAIAHIHHLGILVADDHIREIDAEDHIGLMVQAVRAFVHTVAGMDIQHIPILGHAQAA